MPRLSLTGQVVLVSAFIAGSLAATLATGQRPAAWGLAALDTGWRRLLLLGLLIFVGTELIERRLNWILPKVFPETFLEEGLELFANAYFLLALRARERDESRGESRTG